MKLNDVEHFLKDYLKERLEMLGIGYGELKPGFDLVQSGLLDSMAFVDMVTAMEKHFGVEIDFENEVGNSSFTTLKGLTVLFLKYGR